MKRMISWILVVITVLMMAACNTKESAEPLQSVSDSDCKEEVTVRNPSVKKSYAGEPHEPYEFTTPEYEGALPKLNEQVLFDEGGVRITLLECELDPSFLQYEVPVLVENNTDRKIRLMTTSFAVNKKMIFGTMGGVYADVDAGCTAEADLFFSQSEINKNARNVSVPYEFLLYLTIYDHETGERIMVSDTIAFNAELDFEYGEPKSLYRAFLYEDENVYIRAGKLYEAFRGNAELEISVRNNTNMPLAVTAENVTVNGIEIETDFESWWVLPGCTDIWPIRFVAKDLEAKGISFDDISEISMKFICRPFFEERVLSESEVICIDIE